MLHLHFFSLSAMPSIFSDRTVTLESCWLTSCFTCHIQTVGKPHQFFHPKYVQHHNSYHHLQSGLKPPYFLLELLQYSSN